MTQYLISFNDRAMDHIPDEDMPDVAKASHAVVQEAINAGVWVFGAGLKPAGERRGRGRDGHRRPLPGDQEVIGGFSVVDVASREEALAWAAKIAAAAAARRRSGSHARPRTGRDAPPG